MSTSVFVNTYSYSVTYVTDQMLRSLKNIILWSGLDPSKFVSNWSSTELAITTWLKSRHLSGVTLEVYSSVTESLVGRWDFSIDYSYGSGDDGSMWIDPDAIKYGIRKCGLNPANCNYRIVILTKNGRPDVVGWSQTEYKSTDGFVFQSVGTTIGTSYIGSQLGYWRKS